MTLTRTWGQKAAKITGDAVKKKLTGTAEELALGSVDDVVDAVTGHDEEQFNVPKHACANPLELHQVHSNAHLKGTTGQMGQDGVGPQPFAVHTHKPDGKNLE